MDLRRFTPVGLLRIVAVLALALGSGAAFANTGAVIYTPDAQSLGAIRTEQGAEVSLGATAAGVPALVVAIPGGADYPGFDYPKPAAGVWNLSAYAGVSVDVTNNGTDRIGVNLRVGNPGDWRQSPWNTEISWIAPGQTRTVKVTFGRSFGNPGYALDAARVNNIKLFAANPKKDATLIVSDLKGFGVGSNPQAGGVTAQPAVQSVPAPVQTVAAPVAAPVQAVAAVQPVAVQGAGATGAVIYTPDAQSLGAIRTEQGAEVSLGATAAGVPALVVAIPGGADYPGFDYPKPAAGVWNLSAYAGVSVDVTNNGTDRIGVNLRVGNPGDWRQSPWNTEISWIAPGQTRTVKVTFGRSFGNPGYALDAARVNNIKLFVANPKKDATLIVSDLKGFGVGSNPQAGGVAAQPAVQAVAAPVQAVAAPVQAAAAVAQPVAVQGVGATGAVIYTPDAQSLGAIRTEQGAEVSLGATAAGVPALVVAIPGGADYPGFDYPKPAAGVWNLSAYAGVSVDVTNNGTDRIGVNLRVGNPGDWRQSPWNTEISWIVPGQTRTVKVTFGRSFGNPGYALDAARVNNIKLFVANPKKDATLIVSDLKGFGVGSNPQAGGVAAQPAAAVQAAATPAPVAVQAVTAPAQSAAPAAGGATRASPSISGELLTAGTLDVDRVITSESSVTLVDHEGKRGLYVVFEKDSNYPNIQFPIPAGGWDLSAFGGVEVTVQNLGDKRLAIAMRVDGPGRWQDEPWNTQIIGLGAHETRTIKLTFGQTNNAPGYPLDPSHIVGIQVFAIKPKQDSPVLVYDLKTWGSPQAVADAKGLTSPADREKPVTPPEWLGQRPPVDGDWVLTLNENFDGDSLNTELWTARFPWDGPQPGQLQRYAPQNVIVEGGSVKFKAEKLHGHENNDAGLDTREYTSGLIQSYDKWAQAYGYFEARVKLPTARGLWPAFWMMPDRGKASGLDTWARRDTGTRGGKGMEIDILEHLAEWGPGRNNVAVHWDGYGSEHKSWGSTHVYFGPTPDGWHNFGLLWEPGKLTWFIDGKKVQEWENDRVPEVPAYLKMNIQMGGWATRNVDDAALPDLFEVDYVRAWQLQERLAK